MKNQYSSTLSSGCFEGITFEQLLGQKGEALVYAFTRDISLQIPDILKPKKKND